MVCDIRDISREFQFKNGPDGADGSAAPTRNADSGDAGRADQGRLGIERGVRSHRF